MTFGLRNAGQTFQRFIVEVVRDLDFCFAYVDDILIYSRAVSQHTERLFEEYGVIINLAKCVFGASEFTFLGTLISKNKTQPPIERIQALRDFPTPKTVQFFPKAAILKASLINTIVSSQGKGSTPITWTPEIEGSFKACKENLASAAFLAHPLPNAELGLFPRHPVLTAVPVFN